VSLSSIVRLNGQWIALAPSVPTDAVSVWASPTGAVWHQLTATTPARVGSLTSTPNQRQVYGIQYEAPGTFGGRLMTTHDGVTWTEITSFHDQFPAGNPDHILRTHGWWILGGNTATPDGRRRADIWMSSDLRTWSELPPRLQGSPTQGGSVPLAANQNVVVAASIYPDNALWLWNP
jgi:hypothetical protein